MINESNKNESSPSHSRSVREESIKLDDSSIKLGDLQSSEKLIFDLYIDLRQRINSWASITHQTAQARMGYIGQHLVSVVTGFPGGKSGARGHDLVLSNGQYAEIKTCYRVDQLGKCNSCGVKVASIEAICPECFSVDINRNDDSKWLIGIRHDQEFSQILNPKFYYLVLFEFVNLENPNEIRSSIWQINPQVPGFAFCIVDYRLNIQSKSKSKAAFNLWPYQLKFCLMQPMLIYRSIISTIDNSVNTEIFPGRDCAELHHLDPLDKYHLSRNLTSNKIEFLSNLLGVPTRLTSTKKRDSLKIVENHITKAQIPRSVVADKIAIALYYEDIKHHISELPEPLKGLITAISSAYPSIYPPNFQNHG